MPPFEVREEVLNVVLANLLEERGLLSVPETIRRSVRGRKHRLPDVTVADLWGVRIVIEGRVGRTPGIRRSLLHDSRMRIEEGICPICLSVLYPAELRVVTSMPLLKRTMARESLIVRVISESSDGDWADTTVDGLSEILRRSYELLVSEDVVASAVGELEESIDTASEILVSAQAAAPRLRDLLGIREETDGEDLRISRIAALTLVNAMIFQQTLAARAPRVWPLKRSIARPHVAEALTNAWEIIIGEIDYVPIFSLALKIVDVLSGNPGLNDALRTLAESAMRITGRRAALRHDLMGRIYHRLLADRKYFGAYYTTVPAATLPLKLTLDPSHFRVNWSNLDQVRELRIADLASGTGTLLKAALQSIVDNHVRSRAEDKDSPNPLSLHQALVEDSLWGFDVVPFEIHLAASALAMHEPDAQFRDMRLYTMSLGGGRWPNLGSLDFLSGSRVRVQADLFGSPTGPGRVTAAGEVRETVEVPLLDLCVMNPPFTRSVGGNLLFGHAPPRQRRQMQDELGNIVRRRGDPANITAGLGSVFAALAHQYIKPGGYLALVLPRALLSGVAWGRTRQLIGTYYHVEYVIVSHEPGRWNFSENTSLSECLIVARRLQEGEIPAETKIVNLWVQPKTSIEALTVSDLVRRTPGVHLDAETGIDELRTETQKFGEVIICPPERIRVGQWNQEAAFSQTDLNRVAYHLKEGQIYIPGRGAIASIPRIHLQGLGELGPDRRDIHDGFRPTPDPTPYAAFWGHSTDLVRHLSQTPNRHLSPLGRPLPGRPRRDPHLLWSRSGRLLIAERLRLNTVRVLSVYLDRQVLSNTWWPFVAFTGGSVPAEEIERILVLWLNSTLGVISLIAARVDTEGAWVDLKKPSLEATIVMNASVLSREQRRMLIETYEEISEQDFLRLLEINHDVVRSRVDSAIMTAFGCSEDLAVLREMLSVEPLMLGSPVVTGTS